METKKEHSIGFTRMKYLDLANITFASQDFEICNQYINAFLETINEDSKSGKEITKQFDIIEQHKKEQLKQLSEYISGNENYKGLGELEKTDTKNEGEKSIYVDVLHSRKTVCWTVAMNNGLFHE